PQTHLVAVGGGGGEGGSMAAGLGQNGGIAGVGPGNQPILFAVGGDDATHTRAGGRGSDTNNSNAGGRGQDASSGTHSSGGGGGGGSGFIFAFTNSQKPASLFIVPAISP